MFFLFHFYLEDLPYLSYLFAVTGASRGYGFVEFETEKEMRQAYKVMHIGHDCSLWICFLSKFCLSYKWAMMSSQEEISVKLHSYFTKRENYVELKYRNLTTDE